MTATEEWPGDSNGRIVAGWSRTMHNVGFAKFEDEMRKMLKLDTWRDYTDALGHWRFLPGEFDYFLTAQDIDRDQVMHGIRDIALKATMEQAMDERRTSEPGYRRDLLTARAENPTPAVGSIAPYGYRRRDKEIVETIGVPVGTTANREALGSSVRRYTRTGGKVRHPQTYRSTFEMLVRRAKRLDTKQLQKMVAELETELESRD